MFMNMKEAEKAWERCAPVPCSFCYEPVSRHDATTDDDGDVAHKACVEHHACYSEWFDSQEDKEVWRVH